jgi:hypothetical protein
MMKTNLLKAMPFLAFAGTLVFLGGITLGGSVERSVHPQPILTDPIVGTWECTVPAGAGFPEVKVIKNIHADGTMLELDNAAPPSQ